MDGSRHSRFILSKERNKLGLFLVRHSTYMNINEISSGNIIHKNLAPRSDTEPCMPIWREIIHNFQQIYA